MNITRKLHVLIPARFARHTPPTPSQEGKRKRLLHDPREGKRRATHAVASLRSLAQAQLHLAFLILFLLPACSLHRTAGRQEAAHRTDSLRIERRDSLATAHARLWTTARTIRLSEFTLSPPDSTGRQHITHVRHAEARQAAAHRSHSAARLATTASAEQHNEATASSAHHTDTGANTSLPTAWLWPVAGVLLLILWLWKKAAKRRSCCNS